MKKIIGAILVAGTFACGMSTSIDGMVSGKTFEAQDAIVMSTYRGFFIPTVTISDVSDSCSLLTTSKKPKNQTTLSFLFFNSRADRADEELEVTPGEYKIARDLASGRPAGRVVFAGVERTDAQCDNTLDVDEREVISGTVTLTSIELKEGGKAEGTFELVVGNQGQKLTGSFGASYCDLPEDFGKTDQVCI